MRQRFLPLLAALALAGCGPLPRTASSPPAQRSAGMVSAADPRAAEAGAAMLRAGGSATDAALATMLALTVVEPQSSGIGGGGFLLTSDAAGRIASFDGREEAPMAATGEWFFRDGQPMSFAEAVPGGKSVGVPGNIRLMELAHRAHGKLRWDALFAPAIRLAADGFRITPRLHRSLNLYRSSGALSGAARALYYGADGNPLPVGTLVRNPELAALLGKLAALGPDSFYVGPNARSLVDVVNRSPRNPSSMTIGDLAAYQAKPRETLCGSYRGYRVCGMGPPSSGGTAVFAILKQLERFDLAALGPGSPTAWHLFAESTRLAFADRNRYLADPDHVAVPSVGLNDPAYLAERSALISPTATLAAVAPGNPAGAPAVASMAEQEERGTSHFVAVDERGEVASYTSTIESAFGSGLMVNGYYLNNELTDFSLSPIGPDGRPVANRVEGGKRPRSSMAPTIVYAPDGSVRLAIGAAGDATIIVQVAKAIIAMIDWKVSAQDAIALPVIFAPGETLFVEQGSAHEAMIAALVALGHRDVRPRAPTFKANAVEWVSGRWVGAADPRSEGASIGQ